MLTEMRDEPNVEETNMHHYLIECHIAAATAATTACAYTLHCCASYHCPTKQCHSLHVC
jgi:hypothetical protein